MSDDVLSQEQNAEETENVQIGCKVCGNLEIEDDYKLDLCIDCRDKLSKRPFSVWIKGLFAIMILVLILALSKFPLTINAGIAFERGSRAEKEGRYLTAAKEYEIVTERFPDSTLSLGRLFVVTYNNGDISYADELLQKIAGRTPRNEALVNEVNGIVERMDNMYSFSDDLIKLFDDHPNDNPDQFIELLKTYLQNNSTDVQASYYLSNFLFDQNKFDEAESIMLNILISNPDFYDGHLFMAAVYREKGEFEKAVESCNTVIAHNTEYPFAYSSLARVQLKSHDDETGLETAKKAYELDPENSTITATLSMAYHYNNMIKERDDMFTRFKQFDDNNTYDLDLLNGIFSNQKKWRN